MALFDEKQVVTLTPKPGLIRRRQPLVPEELPKAILTRKTPFVSTNSEPCLYEPEVRILTGQLWNRRWAPKWDDREVAENCEHLVRVCEKFHKSVPSVLAKMKLKATSNLDFYSLVDFVCEGVLDWELRQKLTPKRKE
jgi:hypothetical protein